MELWIMSQNEESLVNVKCFHIEGREIQGLFGSGENGYGTIGIYKSEERAKEVLKDIQKILHPLPKNIIKNSVLNEEIVESLRNNDLILASNQGYNFQQLNSFVYQMPKE